MLLLGAREQWSAMSFQLLGGVASDGGVANGGLRDVTRTRASGCIQVVRRVRLMERVGCDDGEMG